MKSNKFKSAILLIALFLGVVSTSCVKDDNEPIYQSYALFTKFSDGDFRITLDNGDVVEQVTNKLNVEKLKDSTRMFIQFHIISKKEGKMNVDILWWNQVTTKDYVEFSEGALDSLGNDDILIRDLWIAHDYLNVTYYYKGLESHKHKVNLMNITSEDDKNELNFELRHNAGGDLDYELFSGITSFKIDNLLLPLIKGAKVKVKFKRSSSKEEVAETVYE